jgi:hypothetical protein
MEFRILGPLEVLENGSRLPSTGAKQRALLAARVQKPVDEPLALFLGDEGALFVGDPAGAPVRKQCSTRLAGVFLLVSCNRGCV